MNSKKLVEFVESAEPEDVAHAESVGDIMLIMCDLLKTDQSATLAQMLQEPDQDGLLSDAAKLLGELGFETITALKSGDLPSWRISRRLTKLKQESLLAAIVLSKKQETDKRAPKARRNREGNLFFEALTVALNGGSIVWEEIYQKASELPLDTQRKFKSKIAAKYRRLYPGYEALCDKASPIYCPNGVKYLAEGLPPGEVAQALAAGRAPVFDPEIDTGLGPNFTNTKGEFLSLQDLTLSALSR